MANDTTAPALSGDVDATFYRKPGVYDVDTDWLGRPVVNPQTLQTRWSPVFTPGELIVFEDRFYVVLDDDGTSDVYAAALRRVRDVGTPLPRQQVRYATVAERVAQRCEMSA